MNRTESAMDASKNYIVVIEFYAADNETKSDIGAKINDYFGGAVIFSLQEIEYREEKTRFKVVLCNLNLISYRDFLSFFFRNKWRFLIEWFAEQYTPSPVNPKKRKRGRPAIAKSKPLPLQIVESGIPFQKQEIE
jgi:hypothetical protein